MPMSKEAVKDKLLRDKDTIVLNVLPEADYVKLHIEGSENLPLGPNVDDFVKKVDKKYGKSKFFITYCSGWTCNAGPNAAKALQASGFKANDYAGGMQDWSDAGFPISGTEAKASAATATSK